MVLRGKLSAQRFDQGQNHSGTGLVSVCTGSNVDPHSRERRLHEEEIQERHNGQQLGHGKCVECQTLTGDVMEQQEIGREADQARSPHVLDRHLLDNKYITWEQC